jgi:hypothetical protein
MIHRFRKPQLRGSCLCGAVGYSCSADPLFTAVCHCDDCQKQTGTAFSVLVGVARAHFHLEGDVACFTTIGDDTGKETWRHFCGGCGSPVMTILEASPEVVCIKAGTLEDRSWIEPRLHVWSSSAQPWLTADGHDVTVFDRAVTA